MIVDEIESYANAKYIGRLNI